MKPLLPSLLLAIAFVACQHVVAQSHVCATQENLALRQAEQPNLLADMQQAEEAAARWAAQHPAPQKTGSVVVIPTVVHVVYGNATENISDAQILSQIAVLNIDYRRLNADTTRTRTVFKPFAADCEIEFCLAQRDPSGAFTTGITRTSTTMPNFTTGDDVKHTATGGEDAWPTDQYFNIWVCDLAGGILGYAQMPGAGPAETDGVVMGYRYFGTTGVVLSPYNLGRPTTHEVGHWLGLFHMEGSGPCGDDLISDTPRMDITTAFVGCDTSFNTCTDTPIDYPDMIENFMFYADDSCMNLFTLGQKTRMWSFLNTDKLSLQTSLGCLPPVGIDAASDLPWKVEVFPNPSNGTFRIEFEGVKNQSWSASVTDLAGRIVWNSAETSSAFSDVDMSGHAQGLYLLNVASEGKQAQRKIQILR